MEEGSKKKGGHRPIPVSLKGGFWWLLHDISAYGHTNSKGGCINIVCIFAQLNMGVLLVWKKGITHMAGHLTVRHSCLIHPPPSELSWSFFQFISLAFKIVTSCKPIFKIQIPML